MKKILIILLIAMTALILLSCKKHIYTKNYVIVTSDDDYWTEASVIECDSFDMVTRHQCELWVDNHNFTIRAISIKVFTNKYLNNL